MVKFYGRFNLIKTLKYMIERMSGMPSKHWTTTSRQPQWLVSN
jgi:hypothetical protein